MLSVYIFLLLKWMEVTSSKDYFQEYFSCFIWKDSLDDVTSVNFEGKTMHEDDIFCRQDILQLKGWGHNRPMSLFEIFFEVRKLQFLWSNWISFTSTNII